MHKKFTFDKWAGSANKPFSQKSNTYMYLRRVVKLIKKQIFLTETMYYRRLVM